MIPKWVLLQESEKVNKRRKKKRGEIRGCFGRFFWWGFVVDERREKGKVW